MLLLARAVENNSDVFKLRAKKLLKTNLKFNFHTTAKNVTPFVIDSKFLIILLKHTF